MLLAIDASLTSCGYAVFNNNNKIIKIGSIRTSNKENNKGIFYSESKLARMSYIAGKILDISNEDEISEIAIESLSFASIGNATRDLAGLFYLILGILKFTGFDERRFNLLAPQTVKSYAKTFLPNLKYDKKGKIVSKIKMDKNRMIEAYSYAFPDSIHANKANGLGDMVDAAFIGKTYLDRIKNAN